MANGSGNGNGSSTSTSKQLTALKSAVSVLWSRAQFAIRHGLLYGGKRDIYAAAGYPERLSVADYRSAFERDGIAERLLTIYPNAIWAPGISIFETEDPNQITKFEDQVESLASRIDLWSRFRRADVLAGLGHYSVLMIGTADGLTELELPRGNGTPDSILYLMPVAEDRAKISSWDVNPASARFGFPEYYALTVGHQNGAESSLSTQMPTTERPVHWSRIIHFAQGLLDNDVWGIPYLRSVFNRLIDLEKVVSAGGEAAWKRADPGKSFDVDPEAAAAFVNSGQWDDEVTALREQVEDFDNNLTRSLVTAGVKPNIFQTPVANFGSNVDSLIGLICTAKGIAQRIFSGSERGELASSQDRSNWADNVTFARDSRSGIVYQFLSRLIDYNYLIKPSEQHIFWPVMDEMSEPEKASLLQTLAAANSAQYNSEGVIIYDADEMRDKVGDEPAGRVATGPGRQPGVPEVASLRARKQAWCASRGIVAASRDSKLADLALDSIPDSEQDAVRTIADQLAGPFADHVLDLWSRTLTDDEEDSLAAALTNADLAVYFVLSRYDERFQNSSPELQARYQRVITKSARASLAVVESRGSWLASETPNPVPAQISSNASGVSLSFDSINPRVVTWASQRAANLITELSATTKEAVRMLIADGLERGTSTKVLAREIRQRVGLRSDQVRSLWRMRSNGASESELNRRVKKMLRQRSELIARTETMRASNEGLRELWRQGKDAGQISPAIRREWIATLDDVAQHADNDGVRVGIDETWPWGYEPGERPNCRCSQGLVEG